MVITLIVMSQMFYELDAQQCIIRSEQSIRGMMLKGHTFSQEKTEIWLNCLDKCDDDIRCQSFNYVISQDICELNNRTKEARPEDFVPDRDRLYVKRMRERGIVLCVLMYIFISNDISFLSKCAQNLSALIPKTANKGWSFSRTYTESETAGAEKQMWFDFLIFSFTWICSRATS